MFQTEIEYQQNKSKHQKFGKRKNYLNYKTTIKNKSIRKGLRNYNTKLVKTNIKNNKNINVLKSKLSKRKTTTKTKIGHRNEIVGVV